MAAEVRPLPRGRHGISREEVERSQRERILWAMTEAMAERGYVATSVADVLRRARVSRETFYQQFSSKLDCFDAAFDAAMDLLTGSLSQAVPPTGSPADRIAAAVNAYVDAIGAFPSIARLFLVEVHAAGPDAIRRRADRQRVLAHRLAAALGDEREQTRTRCELLVAGIGAMVTPALLSDDPEALDHLRAPLVDLVRAALLDD